MQIALTIAGSDSGGGAGIQADLKTFHQFGVFGTSAVVAVTAQNTIGVDAVHILPPAAVRAQVDAVAGDLHPDAVKSGMLATRELVQLVGELLSRYHCANYVCDPVMVATSGDRLLDRDAERAMKETLLPLATVVTPNLGEAAILTARPVETTEHMEAAGHALCAMGAGAALVKGGHLDEGDIVDVLVTGDGVRRYTHPRLHTTSTHGTGCTLSAAITAGLALGLDLSHAVGGALDFVHRAMKQAPGLGSGHGPLNHLVGATEVE